METRLSEEALRQLKSITEYQKSFQEALKRAVSQLPEFPTISMISNLSAAKCEAIRHGLENTLQMISKAQARHYNRLPENITLPSIITKN